MLPSYVVTLPSRTVMRILIHSLHTYILYLTSSLHPVHASTLRLFYGPNDTTSHTKYMYDATALADSCPPIHVRPTLYQNTMSLPHSIIECNSYAL